MSKLKYWIAVGALTAATFGLFAGVGIWLGKNEPLAPASPSPSPVVLLSTGLTVDQAVENFLQSGVQAGVAGSTQQIQQYVCLQVPRADIEATWHGTEFGGPTDEDDDLILDELYSRCPA